MPQVPSPDFGSFGRYKETPVAEMSPEEREAYDFTVELRGLVPGPHKIWLANPRLSKTIVPIGRYYQKDSSLSKAEIEITTNLINGKWQSSYANSEHEIIGEVQGKLAPDKVRALIANLPTSFEDAREQIVYELVSTLIQPRIVPQGLFQRARMLIGDQGIVDVTMLIGWFTCVSLTLNAYDVPADARGLDQ